MKIGSILDTVTSTIKLKKTDSFDFPEIPSNDDRFESKVKKAEEEYKAAALKHVCLSASKSAGEEISLLNSNTQEDLSSIDSRLETELASIKEELNAATEKASLKKASFVEKANQEKENLAQTNSSTKEKIRATFMKKIEKAEAKYGGESDDDVVDSE
jgi:hypothetical protein